MTDLWTRLAAHRAATEDRTIAALFEADPDRAARFSTAADGLLFDWSKTTLDDEAVRLRRQGELNAAYDRVVGSDVRYRFVIDTATLAD